MGGRGEEGYGGRVSVCCLVDIEANLHQRKELQYRLHSTRNMNTISRTNPHSNSFFISIESLEEFGELGAMTLDKKAQKHKREPSFTIKDTVTEHRNVPL